MFSFFRRKPKPIQLPAPGKSGVTPASAQVVDAAVDYVNDEKKSISKRAVSVIEHIAEAGKSVTNAPDALSKVANVAGAASSLTGSFGKVAAVATGVAAVAAALNPVVLPAVAACALIIAISLRLKIAHGKLLTVMQENTEEMVDIIRFTNFAEYIYKLMCEKDPSLSDSNIERQRVAVAAEKLRKNLIIYSSPNVLKELRRLNVVSNTNISNINKTRYIQLDSLAGRLYSKVARTISAESITAIFEDSLQELFNACTIMRTQFLLFTQINHRVFDLVVDTIKNTKYYQQIFKVSRDAEYQKLPSDASLEEAADYIQNESKEALDGKNLEEISGDPTADTDIHMLQQVNEVTTAVEASVGEVMNTAADQVAEVTGTTPAAAAANIAEQITSEESKNSSSESKGGRRRRQTRRQNKKRRQSRRVRSGR
jgi:hypothetical protein